MARKWYSKNDTSSVDREARTRDTQKNPPHDTHLAAASPLPIVRTSRSHAIVAGAIGKLASGTGPRDTVSDPGCWYGVYERGLSAICKTQTESFCRAKSRPLGDTWCYKCKRARAAPRSDTSGAVEPRQASNREYLLTNMTPPNTFSGFSGLTEQFHLADLNWCWHSSMASLAPALTACKT